MSKRTKIALSDGSRIVIEACARAGADVFIGYPITPSTRLFHYAIKRFPSSIPAPDEITALQWMAGFAAAGKIPVTATSFPGFALMIESINMAFMMELPMLIILAQRLGPSTGTATCGAQGDLLVVRGIISGGYIIPTLCISSFKDCWHLSAEALRTAVNLRTPVILLTSKEMMLTLRSFPMDDLSEIKPIERKIYCKNDYDYEPYKPDESLVPPFLHVGNNKHPISLNATTHDKSGLIRYVTPESMENTKRLGEKIVKNLHTFTYYEIDEEKDAESIIFTYGITSTAARDAVQIMRKKGHKVSLLIAKTLFPAPPDYLKILDKYEKIIVAEENLSGLYSEFLFGQRIPSNVFHVGAIGKMISPDEIIAKVMKDA